MIGLGCWLLIGRRSESAPLFSIQAWLHGG